MLYRCCYVNIFDSSRYVWNICEHTKLYLSKLKHNTTLVERNVFGCTNKFDCFYVYLYISYELLNLVRFTRASSRINFITLDCVWVYIDDLTSDGLFNVPIALFFQSFQQSEKQKCAHEIPQANTLARFNGSGI